MKQPPSSDHFFKSHVNVVWLFLRGCLVTCPSVTWDDFYHVWVNSKQINQSCCIQLRSYTLSSYMLTSAKTSWTEKWWFVKYVHQPKLQLDVISLKHQIKDSGNRRVSFYCIITRAAIIFHINVSSINFIFKTWLKILMITYLVHCILLLFEGRSDKLSIFFPQAYKVLIIRTIGKCSLVKCLVRIFIIFTPYLIKILSIENNFI